MAAHVKNWRQPTTCWAIAKVQLGDFIIASTYAATNRFAPGSRNVKHNKAISACAHSNMPWMF